MQFFIFLGALLGALNIFLAVLMFRTTLQSTYD